MTSVRSPCQTPADVHAWIVIPCYNEEHRLKPAAFDAWLGAQRDFGFLFVNDGSSDRTLEVLRALAARWPSRVETLDQQPNRGKAEAVRVGMLRAFERGTPWVGYFDADLATPLDELPQFARCLADNPEVEIVLGARVALLGRHIERKALRHYLGRVFATVASMTLGLPVYDTQCGAKLLRVSARTRQLFAAKFGSRWVFDVELLARYQHAGGPRDGIFELPVRRWHDVGESHVKPIDFLRAIGEMAQIYRAYRAPSSVAGWLTLVSAPFVRYLGAGGVGTVLHYATLAALVELCAVKPTFATMAGALVGALTNYALNYHLTFASRAPHRHTLPRFMTVALLAAGLSGAGMWVLTEQLHVHYLVAQLVCTFGVLVVGYLLNKFWTFAPRPELELQAQTTIMDAAKPSAPPSSSAAASGTHEPHDAQADR